jgi:hypothetical protein
VAAAAISAFVWPFKNKFSVGRPQGLKNRLRHGLSANPMMPVQRREKARVFHWGLVTSAVHSGGIGRPIGQLFSSLFKIS